MTLLYGLFNWLQNGLKLPYYMASSVDKTTALLYGLFNWQQNGLIVWLIQLASKRATKRPYYMAYSVDNKTAL